MSTRQYIGARYVTKIYENSQDPSSAEWEASVNYEPLTLVTYNYGSYLSKKEVPANIGDPASNPSYWVQTGFYNGQILNLQNQINDIEDCIVTPEMFGAVGDGTTDDTLYVQQALSTGKIVILKGTYKISASLNIPKNVSVLGGSVIFDFSNGVFNGFVVNGNNLIENVSFTDTGTSTYGSDGKIIYGDEVDNISIMGCSFTSIHAGYCSDFYHSTNIQFIHNIINGYSYAGIKLHAACSNCEICFNSVYDGRFTGTSERYALGFSSYTDTGADLGMAHNIKCNYNYVEDVTPLWEGIDSHGAYDYEIIGNIIKNVYKGVVLGSKATYEDYAFPHANSNAIIKNNDISVTALSDGKCGGIIISVTDNETHNIEISNNSIKSNNANYTSAATALIAISTQNVNTQDTPASLSDVIIENNRLDATASTAQLGIAISEATVKNLKINSNTLVATDNSINNAYAIDVHSVTNAMNAAINKNTITGFTRSLRVPNDSDYLGTELIEYNMDNNDNLNYQGNCATYARTAFPSSLAAFGSTGQFIGCLDTSDDTIGWFKRPDGWYEISGVLVP